MNYVTLPETARLAPAGRRLPGRVRNGFTLLELVVVIGIIMALSAILTITLPDLFTSAKNAAMVTNLKEIDDMVQTWGNAHRGAYPNGWDSLVTSTGDFYQYLPRFGTANPCGTYFKQVQLSDQHVARLRRAGITKVCHMIYAGTSSNAQNATLLASDVDNPTTITTGMTLLFANVTGSMTGNKMQFDTTHDYVVFGVGRGTDLVGGTGYIKDQPVIIHAQGCTSPVTTYCAPAVIFDLGAPTTDSRDNVVAQYVGSVALAEGVFLFSEEKTSIY